MKVLFDLTIAFFFSIALIPMWIFLAIGIKLTSKGPVFFRQTRIGKDGAEFKIYKFRTMIIDAEKKGLQLTVGGRDPRITNLGYFLRKVKLDELPQLFNILKLEMSFVGPRPEVSKYVALYTKEQRKVLSVLPGITDIASIEYIDENELLKDAEDPERMYIEKIMQDKLRLNLEYLETMSFTKDLFLIVKTILKVIIK
jgi:lipopolysaccharide/colanic/teichoic acid biosynthesis glycosyltransferase